MEHRGDITRFTAVDRQVDPGFFITFLDAGNALEDIKSVKRVMLAQLELCDGVSLLDVGCGTGDDVRDLAQLVGPRGRVVGVDVSGAMITEAKKRHATSELPVEFVEGDAQNLTFPDASFDHCRTERMLMHLDDPEKALAEMVRVVARVARWSCSTSTGTPCSSIVRTREQRARSCTHSATASNTAGSGAACPACSTPPG